MLDLVNAMPNKNSRHRRGGASRSAERVKRLRLSVCIIAKNEERFIGDCLDSVRDFVDEIIVVDTGSTDRTRQIAREHGARVEEFEWCNDFSAARNASLDAATGDWILVLDADERLDRASGPRLRNVIRGVPTGVHLLAPLIENRTLSDAEVLSTTLSVPRMFRRRPDIRFQSAIHEVVVYTPDPAATVLWQAQDVRIIHYGYDTAVYHERSKDARNVTLLESELGRGSEDPRLPFFLLEQHSTSRRDSDAVAAFELFAQNAASVTFAFWVEAYNLYLRSLSRLGDVAKLQVAESEAAERGALGAAALTFLSEFYADHGELDRAIDYLERMLNQPVPDGLQALDGHAEWLTRLRLAMLLQRRDGDSDGAQLLEHAEIAYAKSPIERRPGIASEVALASLRTGQLEAASVWVGRAVHHAPQTEVAQRQALDLLVQLYAIDADAELRNPFATIDRALAADDLQVIYDLAFELPPTIAGVVRSVAIVERLRSAGETEAALGLLNRALDGPHSEQVYWLLVKTLTDLGRYEEAQLALEALRSGKQQLEAA
jgi:glycosyltransferase involved in cell wall biosynthesis